METFYVTYDEFWEWFNREADPPELEANRNHKARTKSQFNQSNDLNDNPSNGKRMKRDMGPRSIGETEAAFTADARYSIMYCRHKPGKKTKVWEGDGYLSLVNQMAHLCDLRGRMLEEPSLLDDIDYRAVEELGELVIGNTEVQVVELDK